MVEISLSGSGEGLGRPMSEATRQRDDGFFWPAGVFHALWRTGISVRLPQLVLSLRPQHLHRMGACRMQCG
jgi:hypothetical protein